MAINTQPISFDKFHDFKLFYIQVSLYNKLERYLIPEKTLCSEIFGSQLRNSASWLLAISLKDSVTEIKLIILVKALMTL